MGLGWSEGGCTRLRAEPGSAHCGHSQVLAQRSGARTGIQSGRWWTDVMWILTVCSLQLHLFPAPLPIGQEPFSFRELCAPRGHSLVRPTAVMGREAGLRAESAGRSACVSGGKHGRPGSPPQKQLYRHRPCGRLSALLRLC